MPDERSWIGASSVIEELVQRLEAGADPAVRAAAQELVAGADGAARRRPGADARRWSRESADAAQPRSSGSPRDELVQSLLLLHGLHPVDVETRVLEALEKTRPYLALARRQRRAGRRGRRRHRAAPHAGQLPRLPLVGGDAQAGDREGDPRGRARRRRRIVVEDGRPAPRSGAAPAGGARPRRRARSRRRHPGRPDHAVARAAVSGSEPFGRLREFARAAAAGRAVRPVRPRAGQPSTSTSSSRPPAGSLCACGPAPCSSATRPMPGTSGCRAGCAAARRTSAHRRPVGRAPAPDRPRVLLPQHAPGPDGRLLPEPGRRHRVAARISTPGTRSSPPIRCSPRWSPTSRRCWSTAWRTRGGTPGRPSTTSSPIDQCFRLVGIIRAGWKGLSGGTEVWQDDRRSSSLTSRSRPA